MYQGGVHSVDVGIVMILLCGDIIIIFLKNWQSKYTQQVGYDSVLGWCCH